MLHGLITKYVAYELGFNKMISSDRLFSISCEFRMVGDHKGFYSSFYIRLYGFEFNIYDTRHEEDYLV